MTKEDFQKFLEDDLSWRKKELSELLIVAKTSGKEVVLKSVILLLYAHWEGYIKKSSKIYLNYVSEKNIKLKDLYQNFSAIILKAQVSLCLDTSEKLTMANEVSFINSYLKKQNGKFNITIDIDSLDSRDIIDTGSNLKPKTYKNIVGILGLEYKTALSTREQYINQHLLANRNSIGHGSPFDDTIQDDFNLTIDDVEKLKNIIFSIIDCFSDELLDYVEKELYLKINETQREKYCLYKETELEKTFLAIEYS
jgi:hypothetical protein